VVARTAGDWARGGTAEMAHDLHHDIEVAERATVALVIGLVLLAFVVLAAAATVYDVGKWLTIW
jgi:hypothetical protein